MKHQIKKAVCFILLYCLLPLHSLAGEFGKVRFDRVEHWIDGSRHVNYVQLIAQDPSLSPVADKINQAIRETAQIDSYLPLLPSLQQGGTGLRVWDSNSAASCGENLNVYRNGTGYFYLLMEAEGKMPVGRPSHRYYPMLFDMATGERVSFDQLFTDADGAKAYIESYLSEVVEPQLSTYMENNQLFPVPYENFGFSSDGHLILYYPHDQLSFLSGKSGAVAFRFSELWDYLDTSETGIALQMISSGSHYLQYNENRIPGELKEIIAYNPDNLPGLPTHPLGSTMEHILKRHAVTTDSGYYPGGAYFETETPELLGTYLITDPSESYLTGILTGRIDMFGVETGKTGVEEAKRLLGSPAGELPMNEAAAEMYLVCPGSMLIYYFTPEFPVRKGETGQESSRVSLSLYADAEGIIQFVKLSLE